MTRAACDVVRLRIGGRETVGAPGTRFGVRVFGGALAMRDYGTTRDVGAVTGFEGAGAFGGGYGWIRLRPCYGGLRAFASAEKPTRYGGIMWLPWRPRVVRLLEWT